MEEKEHITIGQLSLRQISLVKSVLSRKGFSFKNVKEDSLKEGYTTYGTLKTSNAIIVVRLSNHICSMKNWSERYKAKLKANPKLLKRMGRNVQDPYKERHFFSIVFMPLIITLMIAENGRPFVMNTSSIQKKSKIMVQ